MLIPRRLPRNTDGRGRFLRSYRGWQTPRFTDLPATRAIRTARCSLARCRPAEVQPVRLARPSRPALGSPATELVVTAVTGLISIGDTVSGTGITAGTTILSQLSGTAGGAGTYILSAANTTSAATVTSFGNVLDITAVSSGILAARRFGHRHRYSERRDDCFAGQRRDWRNRSLHAGHSGNCLCGLHDRHDCGWHSDGLGREDSRRGRATHGNFKLGRLGS